MNEKPLAPLCEPIRQLQEQLNQFRLTHARRSKLPEALWTAATALAREHGIYAVAHPLRLDYVGLKKRLAEAPATFRGCVPLRCGGDCTQSEPETFFTPYVPRKTGAYFWSMFGFRYRGRDLSSADILYIRELIAAHPEASRRTLSRLLCEAWQWRQPNGALRDMVCRSMLLLLDRAGQITLPPVR